MDSVRKDWAELKRRALLSGVCLRVLPFSAGQSEAKVPLVSLRWRLYVGVLGLEHFGQDDTECQRGWVAAAEKERSNYTALRRQFVVSPGALCSESAVDWRRMNPLSLDEDSPWFQYHQDQELRTTIMQDVARTFPEEAYFREARVQRLLADILFVYAKLHSSLKYRQGMHELLAPILMAVDGDSVQCDGADRFFIGDILDRRFVEHDAFAVFERLMRICLPWYQAPSVASPRLRPAAAEAAKQQTPIVAQCRLMMEKLRAVDAPLADHLQRLDIEPQLFGIRWYRLLFSREFAQLSDVVMLWDMLLGDGGADSLRLAEWVGIVLLLANRRQLLQGDYADNLSTLLHLPPLPRPSPDALERTPPLRNSPQSPQPGAIPPAASSDVSLITAQIGFAALTAPGTAPVQRLALQAAYLRSRPTRDAAQAVARQYEAWEDDAWTVVGEDARPCSEPAAGAELRPDAGARGGGARSQAPWQGRKMYTSSTLLQRRAVGGTSPPCLSPPCLSPSPPARQRTPAEAVRALGSVTAQVATMAAQCLDLLAARRRDPPPALRAVSAALSTLSRAWQDEVALAAPSASDLPSPRESADADMRLALRDLDRAYIDLSSPNPRPC
ncbi:hypothetical protein GGI02_001693 [Coemansia sp. RSA 2322]|nr:hypothetical protein GGI02_001693 [Coemansia sp. RSA 2322]